jgi:ATP-binding cassette subfamily F protein 3
MRKQERAVKELEDAISAMEKEISEMDRIMADPDNIEDQSMFFSYREKRDKLEGLMVRWEKASAKLENLKST